MASPTVEQSEYLSILEDVASKIQKAQINIKKCPKSRLTEGYIKARIKCLEEDWSTFREAHNNLTRCTPREQRGAHPYFLKEEYYTYEELYLCLKADLLDLSSKLSYKQKAEDISDMSVCSSNVNFAKLPRIQLPTFSGRYEDWPTYQDLFHALVHNTSISDVQKLHYLKTSVSGEAEALLRNIQITESNYAQAWNLLKDRFGNKKMIVNSLLKRLFTQKRVINQSACQIKSLLDTTSECITSLNNLKINTDSWDPLIIFLVGQKLDTESLRNWEENSQKNNSEELPTWEELKKFLESKFRTLELVTPITFTSKEKLSQKIFHVTTSEGENNIFQTAHASISSPQPACVYCNEVGYYIFNCKGFAKQPIQQRHEFIKEKHLCFNCLKPNHSVYMCKQKGTCRICRRRHHSLLHQVRETNQENNKSQPERITTAHFSKQQPGHQVLLATAQVAVKSSNGHTHLLRALIDQGSEASFVSSRVVELLGLKRTDINGVVSGVGEGIQIPIKHAVDLSVKSRLNERVVRLKAYVLKNISTHLPSKHIALDWPEIQTLELADPVYHTPGKIDILLGANVFSKIIEEGLVKMPDGVVAQKTYLGWILSGQKEDNVERNNHNIITLHVTRLVVEDNDMLRQFWEIETDLYKKKKIFTKEEEKCEEIFKNTTKRDKNGRYIVHLPLKQTLEETVKMCGETKQQAIKRFKQLEKKFEKNEKVKTDYTRVIQEYKDMGHMRKSKPEDENMTIYLPHHAVIRDDKETSKLRVVYDASAKGSNGHSLNDTMMVGPALQPDLRSLIIKWRKYKICVVGDIEKMYRMINMTEEHTKLQRIIWRDGPEKELESFDLTTVTFGTAAAPFLAVRTLNQLADDEMLNFPDTAPVIKESYYVDDFLCGNEDIEVTKQMCDEIRNILQKGGFKMHKWSSNSQEVLKYLQEGDKGTKDEMEIKLDKVIKILGLTWDRKEDSFKITVNLPDITYPITKRRVLSDVARLFDPFGWLSPVIITAKVLIQKLWLCSLGWDDELPLELREDWINYRQELTHLQNILIPRWLKTTRQNNKSLELHGFADASTQAYAAVTYLRVVEDEEVHVMIIASRTKVAPLKQLSVPKLELCAAALLAELVNDLTELLNIPNDKVSVWTDSMVVLSWLQSQPSRWRTFVANRVADITRVINNSQWRHVQSADNPADLATRGVNARDLIHLDAWWTGPKWLKQHNLSLDKQDIPQTELESKGSFHTAIEESPIWERFSNLLKLKRVLAYCRRMLNKVNDATRKNKYLTSNELEKILEQCVKYYQNLVYGEEVAELRKNGKVKNRSSLITLSPFLDENGLIRVGGRLQNASKITEAMKHPIIIPKDQHITKLLINDAHVKTLHGGNQLMMAYLRSKYWVVGLKSAVRKCMRSCKICIIDKAKVKNQFMGQLPAVRVNEHRAFINSGVDYAGPVYIRTSKGRGQHATKGYICLFVCMSTRAIHLEAVTDLTSQAFIAAFRRFVARRGQCLNMWSDNGTNFVGAAKELKDLFQMGSKNLLIEVAELLANDGTTWHFIPPRMPTYGGLWEAGVQSAKKHLTRVNKDTKLTYEEMTTLLAQIEACLNSRPLCELDNTTYSPLTPGHFLVGEPLISVPDLNYTEKKISLLTRWQLVQRMTQDFWHRWRTEYLNTLQQRYKWQVPVSTPAIGDLVIIKDQDTPPAKWLLGKVIQIHPGADNLVRVVTVQCKGNHELKRPVSKLIPLPKEIK